MADRSAEPGEMGDEPEFSVRMLGYARGEVDEFVAEVRRELRTLAVRLVSDASAVRVLGAPPAEEDLTATGAQLARLLRYAEEEAQDRVAEARAQAERTLAGARELADRIVGEAGRRAAELEEWVALTLEREVNARVQAMSDGHAQLVGQLAALRDTLTGMLEADAARGAFDLSALGAFGEFVPKPSLGARR